MSEPKPPPSREELVRGFWSDVRKGLINSYRHSQESADFGIGRYRLETEDRKVGDAVYNQGVELTTEVVHRIIEHGLPEVIS
ncbi:hypothetical protein C5Y96_11175 [Blastopirellula marina]|uniref:Uncharacterized protein n=1 Tax=Blastopirellula marina TaxID=124 RepID=A0A2S8FN28_9BACT|nr:MULTISPECIES: hypothetical protein [Pirellulaceae]PQO33400.1 hypothetical protein C5Y96_11175 [Blastopirellula marina]RCS52490.1 hypothetical protein DTL36_11185 [Bremerella cremea]